jgi:hypothetical protein
MASVATADLRRLWKVQYSYLSTEKIYSDWEVLEVFLEARHTKIVLVTDTVTSRFLPYLLQFITR